jgi:hypothetical protein
MLFFNLLQLYKAQGTEKDPEAKELKKVIT